MKQKTILFLLLLASFNAIRAQDEEMPKKEMKRPTYISLSTGISLSSFRDFRTSPLIYTGTVRYSKLSLLKTDSQKETEFGISCKSGDYSNDFNKQYQVSKVSSMSFFYTLMYQVPRFSSVKWNTKIGGQLNLTGNYRDNEGLLNYSLGLEMIPTLFISAKIERDLSRKTAKYRKLFFKKKQLKPRKKNLSYQLNIGLLNSHARSNLPMLYDSYLSTNDADVLGSLEYEMFSGFRLSSSLDYTIFLKNKNAIQFSYVLDAYTTGGDMQQFEMASHTLKISLLFNTNNK